MRATSAFRIFTLILRLGDGLGTRIARESITEEDESETDKKLILDQALMCLHTVKSPQKVTEI